MGDLSFGEMVSERVTPAGRSADYAGNRGEPRFQILAGGH
jgi:hypothetical protein